MRQKRSVNLGKGLAPLISNESISRRFRSAVAGVSYRKCAEIFNASEQAKNYGVSVTKDTVCRLATGNFQVVNKRIKALCYVFNVEIYESCDEIGGLSRSEASSGLDAELFRVSDLAKRNPALEGKLTNLIRGITEIVSSKGV